MLKNIQIIKDKDKPKFAVIDFEEYLFLKDLLYDTEKLENYLDYLHILTVKKQTCKMLSLEEVKKELEAD